MYTIAYVPYNRGNEEKIVVVFADTDKDVIEFGVDRSGRNVNGAEYSDEDGVFYDYYDNPVEISLKDCIDYLKHNFVGDGGYGATLLTIIHDTTILYAG